MTILCYQDFLTQTNKALDDFIENKQIICAVVIDFVGLPELDGILGYKRVDEFLQHAAEQIFKSLPKGDLVTTIGRYQLACLFTQFPSEGHAGLVGYKLQRILTLPFSDDQKHLVIIPRLGISIANKNIKIDALELIRQANSAMQQAGAEHEGLRIYSPDIDVGILSELELLSSLDKAIEESRIFLMYQPHLLLSNRKISGSEALLRWNHHERGAVPPSSMIHLAERTGLITKLTYWVFNTAMRQCAEYRKAGLDLGVSVNFSASNFREPDLVGIVSQALEIWDVPAEHVVIELTETAVMDENKQTLNTLDQFKTMGLQISMDDFGTGYSSMSLLQKLPIDEIKIDLSFTRDLLTKPENEKMVDSIISLAHKLEMRVVAEGVEDWPVLERLNDMGCDVIQGYIIGQPMILQDFIPMALEFNNKASSSGKS